MFHSARRITKLLIGVLVGWCLSLAIAQGLPAQTPALSEAKIREIIDGTEVFIQNQQAKVNDVAKLRQRVRTGEARAELTFNTGVVARLGRNSVLTVGQCARLQRGVMLVNGSINGCTASIVAAVRGTTYVLEVDETGKQEIKVLEGEVAVRPEAVPDFVEDTPITRKLKNQLNSPTNLPSSKVKSNIPTETQPITTEVRPLTPLEASPAAPSQPVLTQINQANEVVLKGGDKLDIDAQGVFSAIRKLTQAEFESLLSGTLFQGFSEQLSSINQIRQVFEGLFPGVQFPVPAVPSVPTPSIPRLPF